MAVVEVYNEVSCPGSMSRFRIRVSKWCTGWEGLLLHLHIGPDVRVTVRLN